jgi:hypothetical protein
MQTIRILQIRHETRYSEQLSTHEETYIAQSANMNEVLLDIGDDLIVDKVSQESSPLSSTSGCTNNSAFTVEDDRVNDDDDDVFNGDNGHAVELDTPRIQPCYDLVESSPSQASLSPQLHPRPLQIVPKSASDSSESLKPSPQAIQPASRTEGDSSDDEGYHYEAVRSSSSQLFLDRNMETRAETGYVNKKTTTAKLYPKFPENLISQAHAVHLGLDVVPHDDEDQVKDINTDGGSRQTTKGTTAFIWSSGISEYDSARGFKVPCYVCDHIPEPLILGRSFLDRKNTYWSSSRTDGVNLR